MFAVFCLLNLSRLQISVACVDALYFFQIFLAQLSFEASSVIFHPELPWMTSSLLPKVFLSSEANEIWSL